MILKKTLLVLVVGFVVQAVISCDCHCPDSHQCKYSYDTMTPFNLDNSGIVPFVSTSDTMPKGSYGIRLSITLKQTAVCQLKTTGSFFAQAMAACNCPPVIQYIANDTIRGINIVTVSNFDDQHPSATDVSDYFTFTPANSSSPIGIPEFLRLVPPAFVSIANPVALELYLITPPRTSGDYSFSVTISLSGSKTLTLTTKSVHLI